MLFSVVAARIYITSSVKHSPFSTFLPTLVILCTFSIFKELYNQKPFSINLFLSVSIANHPSHRISTLYVKESSSEL